jgi:peptidoglycan LD-endopeptidase CwlK
VSRLLDDLDPTFKPLACELLARFTEQGYLVMIVNTRRTADEQAANVAKGVSWVKHSKHEDGLAIDVAPFQTWALYGPDKLQWDAHDPIWFKLGAIGEALGLRWGGRWVKTPDLGHFEYVERAPAYGPDETRTV